MTFAIRDFDSRHFAVAADARPELLGLVEKALRQHDLRPSRFGRDAVNDPRLVFDLRLGRDPRPVTERRVRSYLATLEKEGAHA